MATKTYNNIVGEFGNGDPNGLFFANAYITYRHNTTQWGGCNADTWMNGRRRFLGSERGTGWNYVYSAGLKLPRGTSFKLSLTFTANNRYYYDTSYSTNMRWGYSLEKYAPGTENNPAHEATFGTKNSPAGLTSGDFSLYAANTGSNGSSTITVTLPDSYSEKTVYFYFWGKDASTAFTLWVFEQLAASLTYTEYTNVGNSSITNIDKTILKPNDSFKITISPGAAGTNNPVLKYRIFYSTGTVTINSPCVDKTASNNTITLTYADIGSPQRGAIIYLGILSVGTASGYNSGLTTSNNNDKSKYQIKINRVPSQPTIVMEQSVVPKNGNNYNIKIKSIASTDQDSQALKYYYVLSSSNSTANISGWQQLSGTSNVAITANNKAPYLLVKANDGLEDSGISVVGLTINSGPTGCAISKILSDGFYGYTGFNYTRKLTLEATGSADYTYKWYYCYGNGNYQELGTGQTLKDKTINYGSGVISCKLQVIDKYTDTIEIIKSSNFRYAKDLSSAEITLYNLSNYQNNNSITQYSRNMSLKVLLSKLGEHDLFAKEIAIIIKKEDGTIVSSSNWTSENNFNSIEGAKESKTNNNINKVATKDLGKCILELQFFATNASNEKLKIYSYQKNIELIPLFTEVFSSGTAKIFLNLKEDSSQSIIVNSGPDLYQINSMSVWIESPSTSPSQLYNITSDTLFEKGTTGASSSLTFVSPSNIFQKAKLKSDKDYNVNIYIFPTNVLGENLLDINNWQNCISSKNTVICDFKVLFNSIFKAVEDELVPYIRPQISYSLGDNMNMNYPDWNDVDLSNEKRMINYGEYFYFDKKYEIEPQLEWYYDGNGNKTERITKNTYDLYYSLLNERNEYTEWHLGWKNFDISNLITFNLREYNGKRIGFKLVAKDEYNMPVLNHNGEEGLIVGTDYYLIACRREKPVVSISSCILEDNGFQATLGIDDYGGNNLKYDNFNRQIENPSSEIGAEGSYEIIWYCGEKTSSLSEFKRFDGRIANLSPEGDSVPDLSKNFDLENLNDLTGRIYLQAAIYFYYNNSKQFVSSLTPIFVIYTEGPTVSYRYHQLGINTNMDSVDEDGMKTYNKDVLTISDFQNKQYVRLKGDYINEMGEAITREILIDLKSGNVSGLIIQGGHW